MRRKDAKSFCESKRLNECVFLVRGLMDFDTKNSQADENGCDTHTHIHNSDVVFFHWTYWFWTLSKCLFIKTTQYQSDSTLKWDPLKLFKGHSKQRCYHTHINTHTHAHTETWQV